MIYTVKEIATKLSRESGMQYETVVCKVLPLYIARPLTLQEIGILFSLSREAIRKVEKRALNKLRELDLDLDSFCLAEEEETL
jgi:DNA-directed RNA polymerase sigma subunit (sigma70/sigma32)